jgi:HAD superfamily phosphatase (TIGR01668 family)
MLRRYFCPDDYLESFRLVTPEFLAARNIKALLLDIDNTLAPYELPEPTEEILAWFRALSEANIKAAFVSNNHEERVTRFNAAIGIPALPRAKKPLRCGTKQAMKALGVSRDETAIMGDQVFTDVWAGRRIGIRTILVPPIRDKRDAFTAGKRWLERPILKYYAKTLKEKENAHE